MSWPTVGNKGETIPPNEGDFLVAYTDDGRPVWMPKGARPAAQPPGFLAQFQMADLVSAAMELGAAKTVRNRIEEELAAASPAERTAVHDAVFGALHRTLQRFGDHEFEHYLKRLIPEVAEKSGGPERAKLLADMEERLVKYIAAATTTCFASLERELEARIRASIDERVKAALDVAVKAKVAAELAEVFKRVHLDVKVDMEGINDLLDRVGANGR